jgi:hypothetical protein
MKRVLLIGVITAAFLGIGGRAHAGACLRPEEAQHIGENTCVCGVVASTHYASPSKSQPTFLNLDKPRLAFSRSVSLN